MIWNLFSNASVHKPSNTAWIENYHEYLPRKGNAERDKVIQFWVSFYEAAIEKCDIVNMNEYVPMKNDFIYKQAVFQRLDHHRGMNLSEDELRDIQRFIEESTFEFDVESMYKIVPNVIRNMIKKGEESSTTGYSSAYDFLLASKNLSEDDKALLTLIKKSYTLEVLIIHVLSVMFNSVESTSAIRLSSLVDRLDSAVRSQISLLKRRKLQSNDPSDDESDQPCSPKAKTCDKACDKASVKGSVKGSDKASVKAGDKAKTKAKNRCPEYFSFGTVLVEFMQKMELIDVSPIGCGNIEDDPIRKKGGSFFVAKHQYVSCQFPVSDLPIRLSLPMVCKPEEWKSVRTDGKIFAQYLKQQP